MNEATEIIDLDKLPRLPNTKLNRNALPIPDLTKRQFTDYTPPKNATEEIIVGIWSDVLGVERISSSAKETVGCICR